MDKIYINSGSLKGKKIERLLDLAEEIGWFNIELSAGIDFERDIEEKILERSKKFSFLIHNYFPPPEQSFVLNFASDNEKIIDQGFKLARKAIDISKKLGNEFYSVHCGFTFDASSENLGNSSQMKLNRISMERAYANFIKNITTLNNYAKEKNVKLAIENNVVANFGLLNGKNEICIGADLEGLNRIFNGVKDPNLFLLLDLGHAKVNVGTLNINIEKLIDVFEDRIIAVHISDNDGNRDSNSMLKENSDLIKYLKRLKNRYLILETYNLEKQDLINQLDLISGIVK